MVKVAFITGITGQDGSYLAELLLEKEYKVLSGTQEELRKNKKIFNANNVTAKSKKTYVTGV